MELNGDRFSIDSISDDVRLVIKTARFGFWVSVVAISVSLLLLSEAIDLEGQNRDLAQQEKIFGATAAGGFFLWLAFQFSRMRRGRSVVPMRCFVCLLIVVNLIAPFVHLFYIASDTILWRQIGLTEIGAGSIIYMASLGGLLHILEACQKGAQLSAFEVDGLFASPLNLLEALSFKPKRLFVLGVLSFPAWPRLAFWGVASFASIVLALLVLAPIYMVSLILSGFLSNPTILEAVGPWTTRPVLELAVKCNYTFRRCLAIGARELLILDCRRPILLLRSFADDSRFLTNDDSSTWSGNDWFSFEESSTRLLNRHGPVIAIGRPGEPLPTAGAAREYIENESWQNRVEELIGCSSVIVAIAASTAGISWELRRIEQLDALARLIVVVPGLQQSEIVTRASGLSSALGTGGIGSVIADRLHVDSAVVGFRQGSIFEIGSSRRNSLDYRVAIEIAVRAVIYGANSSSEAKSQLSLPA